MWILESEQTLHPHERRRPWILDFVFFCLSPAELFSSKRSGRGRSRFLEASAAVVKRICHRAQRHVLESGEQRFDLRRVVGESTALVGNPLRDLEGAVGGASRVRFDASQQG